MKKLLWTILASTLVIQASFAATPANTLVVATSLDGIISLDPAESFEIVSTGSLVNIYQRLVIADRHNPRHLVPQIAQSWQPGKTDHSLIFHLNKNSVFASGNHITAQDVIFSLSRVIKLNKTPSFILTQLGWTPKNIDSQFTLIDDETVEIRWTSAIGNDLALRLFSAPVASIVDQKTVTTHVAQNDYGNQWLKNHSAGSGAYTIKNYTPQEALVLAKNSHASPQAKLQHVILKNVADAGSRRLMVEQGDADIAYSLGADQFAQLQKNNTVQVLQFPSANVYYLGLNTQDKTTPELGNSALWQAARWLIDYQSIAHDLLKDQYQIHQAFLPIGFDGALTEQPFHLDIEKAKSILKKANIKPHTKFSLTIINQPPYTDIAQAIQSSFAKADIQITIHPVAEAELWGNMRNRNFQSIFIYWGPDYIDPNTNASTFAFNVLNGPKTLAWRLGWNIPDLSQETLKAAAENDSTKRNEIYTKLQKDIQSNSPYIVVLQDKTLLAAQLNIQNIQQDITSNMIYFDAVSKK